MIGLKNNWFNPFTTREEIKIVAFGHKLTGHMLASKHKKMKFNRLVACCLHQLIPSLVPCKQSCCFYHRRNCWKYFATISVLLLVAKVVFIAVWYDHYSSISPASFNFMKNKALSTAELLNNNINNALKHLVKAQRFERNRKFGEELKTIESYFHRGSQDENIGYDHIFHEVTVILDCVNDMEIYMLLQFLESITLEYKKHKDLNIIVGLAGYDYKIHEETIQIYTKTLQNLQIVEVNRAVFHKEISTTRSLGFLIQKVKTKFILFGRKSVEFNNDSFIKMMTFLLKENSIAAAVSGAFITSKREYHIGCYQLKSLWSQLTIRKGYDRMDGDGNVYCDYTSGPFVVSTQLFQTYLNDYYTNLLKTDLLFMDFFNTKYVTTKIVLKACTQCLWKIDSTKQNMFEDIKRDHWLQLLNRMELNELYLENDARESTFKFTYNEGYTWSCRRSLLSKKTLLLPKVCINELDDLLAYSVRHFHSHQLSYNIDTGTALGSAKLFMTLPWEKDHDLIYRTKDFLKLITFSRQFKNKGYDFKLEFEEKCVKNRTYKSLTCGYMGIKSKHWRMELWGQNILVSDCYTATVERLPVYRIKGNATLSWLEKNNLWLTTANNPGLYSRSRYGLDCLKHHRHWLDEGHKNSFKDYVVNKHKFIECEKPGDHKCMDNFLNDGNLIFRHKPWA